jgi:hypothetical protein
MKTPVRWNASGSALLSRVSRPRWTEVRQGLSLVLGGHLVLLALIAPSLSLVWHRPYQWPPLEIWLGLSVEEVQNIGLIIACVGVALAYLLLLAGQWRCLTHSTQGHGAKELLFAAMLCALIAPLCLLAGHFLGTDDNFAFFVEGLNGRNPLALIREGSLFPLAAALLAVLNVVLFTGFLRAVVRGLGKQELKVTYFCFVGFLLGGTTGNMVFPELSSHPWVQLLLASGWALGLLWHVALVIAVRKRLSQALRQRDSQTRKAPSRPPVGEPGQVALRVLSLRQGRL